MTASPKKSRQPKLKKLNLNQRDLWKTILKDVNKDEIPVELLLAINVNLLDGTKVKINIKDLIDQGHNPDDLQEMLGQKFQLLDAYIKDIDYYVSIDDVANIVQPVTDKILKDL